MMRIFALFHSKKKKEFPWGWCPGSGNLSQNGLKLYPHLLRRLQKTQMKNFPIFCFVFFLIDGTNLTGFFEGLNSSLARSASELLLESFGANPCGKRLALPGLKGRYNVYLGSRRDFFQATLNLSKDGQKLFFQWRQ